MKAMDKKVMSITTAVALLSASILTGGITGYHLGEAEVKEFNAESGSEEEKHAKHEVNFWRAMRVVSYAMAGTAGYAAGVLIKDAFNLGKKH